MINLSQLLPSDIEYICGLLSPHGIRMYFQKNPKPFAEIRRGSRPAKLSDAETLSIVVKNISKPFINSLVVGRLQEWLNEIKEHRDNLQSEGLSVEEALLKTIPESVFSGNSRLYFRLIEEPFSENFINLFDCAMKALHEQADNEHEEPEQEENDIQDPSEKETTEIDTKTEENGSEFEKVKEELNEAKKEIEAAEQRNADINAELQKAKEQIAELQTELNTYHNLSSFADEEQEEQKNPEYDHVSVCMVIHDQQGRTRLSRLADIVNGEIIPFTRDDTKPKRFDNRDRLFWRDGPSEDNSIGIWAWKAVPNMSDPSTDYVISTFQEKLHVIEVVEPPHCKSIADVSAMLIENHQIKTESAKVLYVCANNDGTADGLLCSTDQFEQSSDSKKLKSSVFMLPHYTIRISDVISVAGMRILKHFHLGIPQSVFRVRSPYALIKKMVLERSTWAIMRVHGLAKKDAQFFRNFIKELPVETLVQELSDEYSCSLEDAQKYVNEFISHADSYLSENDLDGEILIAALERNGHLLAKCKDELTRDWEKENEEIIQHANAELHMIEEKQIEQREELERIQTDHEKAEAEIKAFREELSKKEKLAEEVSERVSSRIQEARENAAQFISEMAFVSPMQQNTIKGNDKCTGIYRTHIVGSYLEEDDIDDLYSFEEELAENLEKEGYNEKSAIEMAQGIAYCICKRIPIVVGENADCIANCIAAMFNADGYDVLFMPISDYNPNELISLINDDNATKKVYLINGVFDAFNPMLFNSIQYINKTLSDVIFVISLQGTPAETLPPSVWNHALYIDGDAGLEKCPESTINCYTCSVDFNIDYEAEQYKKNYKSLQLFESILSNTAMINYAKYLSAIDSTITECELIKQQIKIIAKACGKINEYEDIS